MILFIMGFMIGGVTIMAWAIVSQDIAVRQGKCSLCQEYHEHSHTFDSYDS